MSVAKEYLKSDYFRYNNDPPRYVKKLLKYFRLSQFTRNPFLRLYYRFRFRIIKSKHGLEIWHNTKIGKGLYLGHPYNITINEQAVLGENINMHKGVTIGQENRGSRKGSPKVGNNVWIGINATVVGKITIGDDVLIAPNSYVNRDIPSHSVVFGNPCVITHKDNATLHYINNTYNG